jgi:hypothetical protein
VLYVCAAACVWPEGEQATALNEASGVPRDFVWGGRGSTNSVEDREDGDLGAVAP